VVDGNSRSTRVATRRFRGTGLAIERAMSRFLLLVGLLAACGESATSSPDMAFVRCGDSGYQPTITVHLVDDATSNPVGVELGQVQLSSSDLNHMLFDGCDPIEASFCNTITIEAFGPQIISVQVPGWAQASFFANVKAPDSCTAAINPLETTVRLTR
jgi:hypothetical protein